MVDLRELRLSEARRRRIIEKLGSEQRERLKTMRINAALDQLRLIIADDTFRKLMQAHGTVDIPELLSRDAPNKADALDASLDFLIAWRFIAPLLYDPRMGAFLDAKWQQFTIELRDLFIALVADGPFPYEERGRPRRTM